MEEFCVVLANHAIIGEIQRIKSFFATAVANTLPQDAKDILLCCIGLALGNVQESLSNLKKIKSTHYGTMVDLVEMLYLNSLAIKEPDKIDVLKQNIELESSSLSAQVLLIGFVACCIYDLKTYITLFQSHCQGDEVHYAMLLIAELLSQQNQQNIEKYTSLVQEASQSPMGVYALLVKSLTEGSNQIRVNMSTLKLKTPLFAADMHDQMLMSEIPISNKFFVLNYINQQRSGTNLNEYLKNNYQNAFNQLIFNLAMGNFQSEPDAILAIQAQLEQLVPKIIGKPILTQQKERFVSLLIQIARAFPTPQVLLCLCEYIENNLDINKYKQMDLLLAYFLGTYAVMQSSQDHAQRSIQHFNEVFNTAETASLNGLENFCFKSDDIFILAQAMNGKFEEVRQQLKDLVREEEDDGGEVLIQLIVDQIEIFKKGDVSKSKAIQLLTALKRPTHAQPKLKLTGSNSQMIDISYGYILTDTLAYTCVCQYINDYLQNKPILHTELLNDVRTFFENQYATAFSCKQIRYCKMLVYNNLQIFDLLLREASDLSAFASSENNMSISTQELILAASAAAQCYRQDEASTYASQALIIDPGIEKSPDYARVIAKICAAKGQFLEAYKRLNIVLQDKIKAAGDSYKVVDLVPLRLHLALLKIRANEVDGFEIIKNLQQFYPPQPQVINIDMNPKNEEFLAMHIAIEKGKAILYILRQAGVFNAINTVQQQESSFDQLLNEHSILFFDSQQLIDKFNDKLNSTFAQGNTAIGSKYLGSVYGSCPINTTTDVFYPKSEIKPNEILNKFCTSNKFNIQFVVNLVKPYLQFSLDATELLSSVHLTLLNDKVGYVQCFNQLIKSMPSTSRLSALASAHLSVGNAKQAQDFYGKAIQSAQDVIKNVKLPEYIETLIISFLHILRSRALSRCHRYQECEAVVKELLSRSEFVPISPNADNESRLNGEAKHVVFAIVSIEYMKLQIKLRKYSELNQLVDAILKNCIQQFNLPTDQAKTGINSIPLPVVYLAVYSARAKAELIHLNYIQIAQTERLDLLQKCVFWCESNILMKTQRVLPAKIDLQMKMCVSVFSTQPSKINIENMTQREQVGLRGIVMSAEIRVEIAELYMDLAKIDQQILQSNNPVLTTDRKQNLIQAYEHAKQSLKAESARGLLVCSLHNLLIDQNLENARGYAMRAKDIESFNGFVQALIAYISHRMNFDNTDDNEDSDKANTPFEDATKILQVGLNVDRIQALDTFLLNSCLVHDMTVVTESLFKGEEEQAKAIGSEQILTSDFTSLTELNERSDKAVVSSFDGYFHLGRGFLSLKMGRIQAGFKDIMTAVNSQTLCDRYKARALFILGSVYINPSRAPLYGFTSCLSGKQKSAVALQKQAMGQIGAGDNVSMIDDQVQQVDNEDVVVPDTEVLNQRDEDIQEAVSILTNLDQMAQKQVPEAAELSEVMRGIVHIGQYQQAKDRIARVMQDEGKTAKNKLSQLEQVKEEAKAQMLESTEALHEKLLAIDKNQSNYVVILYVLGVLYVQLKNDAKARSSFTTGAKQITNIKELGASAQQSQAQLWLDVDASVQCNLALADQYICIGKITNALRSLDSVAALDKIQAVSYELYGLCMEKESAFDDAVRYYESAWLLSKGSPSVAYRLAYNYMKANKYEDAILMCQSALNEWQNFGKLRKEVLYKAEQYMRTAKEVK